MEAIWLNTLLLAGKISDVETFGIGRLSSAEISAK